MLRRPALPTPPRPLSLALNEEGGLGGFGQRTQEEQLAFASHPSAHCAAVNPGWLGGIVSVFTIGQTDGEPTETNVPLATVLAAVAPLAQARPSFRGGPSVGYSP